MTKTIKHPYFGELNPDYVIDLCCWEFSFSFEGEEIDVVLWESEKGKGISEEMLDFFADFLQDFANKSRIAREMLKRSLNENDDYILCHIEEMELDVPDTVEDFVDMMVIDHISCWGNGKIIIDYMIDPEESGEILAVTFYKTGETEVVWEGL